MSKEEFYKFQADGIISRLLSTETDLKNREDLFEKLNMFFCSKAIAYMLENTEPCLCIYPSPVNDKLTKILDAIMENLTPEEAEKHFDVILSCAYETGNTDAILKLLLTACEEFLSYNNRVDACLSCCVDFDEEMIKKIYDKVGSCISENNISNLISFNLSLLDYFINSSIKKGDVQQLKKVLKQASKLDKSMISCSHILESEDVDPDIKALTIQYNIAERERDKVRKQLMESDKVNQMSRKDKKDENTSDSRLKKLDEKYGEDFRKGLLELIDKYEKAEKLVDRTAHFDITENYIRYICSVSVIRAMEEHNFFNEDLILHIIKTGNKIVLNKIIDRDILKGHVDLQFELIDSVLNDGTYNISELKNIYKYSCLDDSVKAVMKEELGNNLN